MPHDRHHPAPAAAALALAGLEPGVLVVQRDDEVLVSTLPRDLPVAVRLNTDDTVSVTIGHRDEGDALLADLRTLIG
jgi:hypothetical protein